MKKLIALLGTGLLALTACGGPAKATSEATSAPETAQTNTVGTPSPVNTPKPSESPTEAPKASTAPGVKTLPYATITMMGGKDIPASSAYPYWTRGYDIKFCATQTMTLNLTGWVFTDSQDRQYTPVKDINEFFGHPLPGTQETPATVKAGKCARGWITFYNETKNENLVGQTLTFGEGLEGGTVEWKLSE